MCVVRALVEDLVQARDYLQLLVVCQVQEAILPDEFEDGGRVGYQERILRVLFKYQPQALLLL